MVITIALVNINFYEVISFYARNNKTYPENGNKLEQNQNWKN